MKTVFPLLSFLFVSLNLFATHFIGGEVGYEQIGADTYIITLTVFRDCGPNNTNDTGFDAQAPIGIYENGTLILNLEMDFSTAVVSNLNFDLNNPCLTLPPEVCIERAVYSSTITLPDSQFGYDLVYQRCCRNPSIVNIQFPEDSGATFWAQIPPTNLAAQNSSPIFNNLLPVALCANVAFVFDHSATDLDGDELVYAFCDPMLGADPDFPAPSPPLPPPFNNVSWEVGFGTNNQITSNPSFSIDPTTGFITGVPDAVGQYVYGICVEEYRDGVLLSKTNRDFQFNVVLCAGAQTPSFGAEDICTGNNVQFENFSNSENFWLWDFGVSDTDSDTSTDYAPSFDFPDFGTYNVTLVMNPGSDCSDQVTIPIVVFPEDPIELQFSYSVPGECSESTEVSFLYTGEGADELSWDLGDGEFEEGVNIDYQYDNFGNYTVSITGYNAYCDFEETASFDLDFQNYLVAERLVLPNVFSPNNDGKNDVFIPFFGDDNNNPIALPEGRSILDYLEVWEIRVYNRWGNMIFENSKVQPGWDGRIEGEPVSEGSYYCVVIYKKLCENIPPITLEHTFTLMR